MNETWKPVAGFGGLYEVSDQGQVRSLDRTVHSTSKQIYRVKGRILKGTPGSHGYPTVSLRKDKLTYKRLVHRLVLETFVGECLEGQEACHNNGIRTDNRVENLRWDTSKSNHADMYQHGTIYQLDISHCPSGHEYTKSNTYLYDGRRYCRTCRAGGRKAT